MENANLRSENERLRRQNKALRQMALVDWATQTFNRRALNFFLKQELKRAQRQGHYLALIMIDLDRFKAYNDTHGHPAGDQLLRQVAQAIQSCVARPGDFVARYGGDEFVVVLPHTDRAGAIRVANKIRAAIGELPITGSLGIADGVDSVEALIKSADNNLYAAKAAGRNRVA